jgi:methionyl-tRNA formyltransferase
VPSLNLIFAGSGEFGLPTLRALLSAGHRVLQVFSQPDRPAGRGKKLTPTPIAQYALEQNLPLVRTPDINAESPPPADVLIVIAFGQKIAPHIVSPPRLGAINLHASLLPKYRGAAPINWAILRGETHTGNSVIRLANRMDAGALLGQSRLEIGELETAGELHDRLAENGAPLTLDVLRKLADGSAVETSQDEAQATLAPKLSRDSTHLDWNKPAAELARQIRGLYPWPGCRVRIVGEHGQDLGHVTLVRARPNGQTSAVAGTLTDSGLLAAGDGIALQIIEVQPEGKRPMSLEAYKNGHPWTAGMRLESM